MAVAPARALDAGTLAWCQSRLDEHFGGRAALVDVFPVLSRLGTVHRLAVEVRAATRYCYLKSYGHNALSMDLAEHAACVSAVSAALRAKGGLLPYDVFAVDTERGVQLSLEVAGRSLRALHRTGLLTAGGRHAVVEAWRGVGRWLATLHWESRTPVSSQTRAAELVDYTEERLQRWAREDPARSDLATRTREALGRLSFQLRGRPVTTTLSHGDISAGNIMVHSGAVGLIDLDDLRFDMPAVDLSQALLEIERYSQIGSLVLLPRLQSASAAALREGYGRAFPEGPELWLPHLRNLIVFLVTVNGARNRATPASLFDELRYRRTLAELRRTLDAASPGGSFRPDEDARR